MAAAEASDRSPDGMATREGDVGEGEKEEKATERCTLWSHGGALHNLLS